MAMDSLSEFAHRLDWVDCVEEQQKKHRPHA